MANDMFLKLSGITGESQDERHPNELDIQSWNWGMSQPNRGGREQQTSRVTIRNIVCIKTVDASSPSLMAMCCRSTLMPEGRLTCRKAGDKVVEYYVLRLTNVYINRISVGISKEDFLPLEEIELNFESVDVEYTGQAAAGQARASTNFGWTIWKNQEG